MAKIRILQYPDPKLKRKAVRVEVFDDALKKVIDDMFETHYSTPNCAALAATQLDLPVPYSITVIDYSENKDQPLCLVNPEIVERSGEQYEVEGCMSVYPDAVHEKVKRAERVKVKAYDRHGKPIEIEAEGFFAKCLQHEIDHLHGNVFLDKIPPMKKERLLRRIKKYQRVTKSSFDEPKEN